MVERADTPFVKSALQDTDRRVGEGKPVAPSFLLACVLWSDVRDGWAQRVKNQQPAHPALQDAIEDVFNARIGDVSGRGRLAGDMREIWLMQPRFERRVGSMPFGLVEQPRFRAAFDFMRLRAENGELDEVLADWWEEFSLADDNLRRDMVDEVRLAQQRARSTRVHKLPVLREVPLNPQQPATHQPAETPAAPAAGGQEPATDAAAEQPQAPKKRRRRRRSIGGAGGQNDGAHMDNGTPTDSSP